jgi:hypothetical protein
MITRETGAAELILPCYEKLRQDMAFDPEASAPQVPEFEPWNLEKHYPRTLRERVADLAKQMGWDEQRLEQEQKWMEWLYGKERSTEDGQVPQSTQAAGHPESSSGGATAEGHPERDSEVGQGGADRNGKDGSPQPVPGRSDPKAAVGGQPTGGGQEADSHHGIDGAVQ